MLCSIIKHKIYQSKHIPSNFFFTYIILFFHCIAICKPAAWERSAGIMGFLTARTGRWAMPARRLPYIGSLRKNFMGRRRRREKRACFCPNRFCIRQNVIRRSRLHKKSSYINCWTGIN